MKRFPVTVYVTCRNRSRPRQLVWCGKDAVLATWATSMALVGFEQQDVRFKMDEITHVVAEADGCRVISNTKHYFLQKVSARRPLSLVDRYECLRESNFIFCVDCCN